MKSRFTAIFFLFSIYFSYVFHLPIFTFSALAQEAETIDSDDTEAGGSGAAGAAQYLRSGGSGEGTAMDEFEENEDAEYVPGEAHDENAASPGKAHSVESSPSKGANSRRDRQSQGSKAQQEIRADAVIKSFYTDKGRSLDVDPD